MVLTLLADNKWADVCVCVGGEGGGGAESRREGGGEWVVESMIM